MEKQNKLPDVIFMSPKASELLKTQITDYCACIDYAFNVNANTYDVCQILSANGMVIYRG